MGPTYGIPKQRVREASPQPQPSGLRLRGFATVGQHPCEAAFGGSKTQPAPALWGAVGLGFWGPKSAPKCNAPGTPLSPFLCWANRALASVTLTNCISCYRHTQRQPPEWSGARFDGQTAPTCFTNPRAGHGWGIGDRRSAGDVWQSKQPKGSSASVCPLPACGRRGGRVRLAALGRRWNGCGPFSGGGGGYR